MQNVWRKEQEQRIQLVKKNEMKLVKGEVEEEVKKPHEGLEERHEEVESASGRLKHNG